jgi:hypothetical protein
MGIEEEFEMFGLLCELHAGDDSLLQGLIVRSTCAAEAQARFNLLVAPALVGCAAAGPNAAMLRVMNPSI